MQHSTGHSGGKNKEIKITRCMLVCTFIIRNHCK